MLVLRIGASESSSEMARRATFRVSEIKRGLASFRQKKGAELAPFSGRNEATRTPDPYVPNVVRYQLRYIPILAV